MNKVILTTSFVLICILPSYSQTTQTRSRTTSNSETVISGNSPNKTVSLASGTRLTAELQKTIDVRKAQVGDEVVLKTTQAIKSEGSTVVKKGARLIGRVTEVSQKSEANGESRVGILFDRLESGSLEVAIAATITSITKSQVNSSRSDSNASTDTGVSSSTSAKSTSSSNVVGGVVGGVTNAVGGVVNASSSAAGDLLGNTATTVGSTVNSSTSGTVGSLGRIQITESADASASGGSVLSLRGENLRVEKGTKFSLVLTQSASGGTRQ